VRYGGSTVHQLAAEKFLRVNKTGNENVRTSAFLRERMRSETVSS